MHKNIILWCCLTISALVIFSFNHFQLINKKSSLGRLLYAPPAEIKNFSLGYKEIVADGFWLRALQDIDVCEQQHAPVDATRIGLGRVFNCDKGWVYQMLDVVFETAPRWRLPAAVGPLMLSVVVDDINGATLLFKKAVKNFPNDWPIHFRAGYHFLYEVDDKLMAAQLYNRAGELGAPKWAHSLAAKLFSETGRNYVARIVLQDALVRLPEGPIRNKILDRLREVESKIQKIEKSK